MKDCHASVMYFCGEKLKLYRCCEHQVKLDENPEFGSAFSLKQESPSLMTLSCGPGIDGDCCSHSANAAATDLDYDSDPDCHSSVLKTRFWHWETCCESVGNQHHLPELVDFDCD